MQHVFRCIQTVQNKALLPKEGKTQSLLKNRSAKFQKVPVKFVFRNSLFNINTFFFFSLEPTNLDHKRLRKLLKLHLG